MNGLIIGRGEYGKSSLAKALCKKAGKTGRRRLVYDPNLDPWPAEYVTDVREEFISIFWGSYDLFCIVDEGQETASQKEKAVMFTATRGRHRVGARRWGHATYFVSHQLRQLNKTLRGNCPELFLFACDLDDARDLSKYHGAPQLRNAPAMPPGYFYHVAPGQPCRKFFIDFRTLEVHRIHEKTAN